MQENNDHLTRIRAQVEAETVQFTTHAHAEMEDDDFSAEDVLHALRSGELLEDYPDEQRGACCLVNGLSQDNRPLHVVCTTGADVLGIITVYEPKPPKWITPRERRPKP